MNGDKKSVAQEVLEAKPALSAAGTPEDFEKYCDDYAAYEKVAERLPMARLGAAHHAFRDVMNRRNGDSR